MTDWTLGESMTFRAMLARQAELTPGKVFIQFDDLPVTFADAADRAEAAARGLARLGLQPGDSIALFVKSSPEWVDIWLGAPQAGVVTTPFNLAFRGDFLAHQLRDSRAAAVLVDPGLVPLLRDVVDELPALRVVVVRGTDADAADAGLVGSAQVVSSSSLYLPDDAPDLEKRALPWDAPACVFYTSGTTGPSKGAVLTQHYLLTSAGTFIDAFGFTADDVIYGAVPLFHFSGSLGVVLPALMVGMTGVLDSAFHVSTCWDRVRAAGATVFVGVGPMLLMLDSLPPDPADRELPLRLLVAAPVPAELHRHLEERYGVEIVGGYGLTEVFPLALHRVGQPIVPGSAGIPNPNFDVVLFDDDDRAVPTGAVGEICCRPRVGHAMFEGYHGRAEETLRQFRNLWFHTGDLGRFDEDGILYFVDRKKDAIRRRGENISSFEVERAVLTHPEVSECAAHAVPSPLGEDDVKIVVVRVPGSDLGHQELFGYCVARLPKFALPRYIEFVTELPKNAVGRVQKVQLRERPVSDQTWDAELPAPAR